LKPLARVTDHLVRARAGGSDSERRRHEGVALLAALPAQAWPIALDPRGRSLSSEKFAERLQWLEDNWPHAVVFVLGSDVGLDSGVREAAKEVLSFGPMTLPHELARVVLYEQIYRAMTIRKGINYHR
jgi:23S rRNA (pseudouridine1915-N3)-methyltransferase